MGETIRDYNGHEITFYVNAACGLSRKSILELEEIFNSKNPEILFWVKQENIFTSPSAAKTFDEVADIQCLRANDCSAGCEYYSR